MRWGQGREGEGEGVGIAFQMKNALYIQTSFGSLAVGARAMPNAEPKAVWRRKMDMTNAFMLGGALVKAYSSPVMLAKISDSAMRKYAGV